MNRQRIFSGVKPSGDLHIGNYLGAIKQWVELQEKYDALFCVVDLHAITVPQDPNLLHSRTIDFVKTYVAAGIDPNKSVLFVQSQVSEHSELAWILNTLTKNGDLTKMTQFKDKTGFDPEKFDNFLEVVGEKKNIEEMIERAFDGEVIKKFFSDDLLMEDLKVQEMIRYYKKGVELGFDRGVNNVKKYFREMMLERFNSSGVGLFDYPVLMAADILLYGTAAVPVGDDQVQHVELTRTIARRFNKRFGDTFLVPEAKVQKEGARIMALDNPAKKMSKSAASEYNYIALMDDPELAQKKIMKAVTDSGSEVVYSEEKPALKNLINIYSLLGNISTDEVVAKYRGKGYADFKKDLGGIVADFLMSFQEKYHAISESDVRNILASGAERARAIASAKMREVKEKVGFVL